MVRHSTDVREISLRAERGEIPLLFWSVFSDFFHSFSVQDKSAATNHEEKGVKSYNVCHMLYSLCSPPMYFFNLAILEQQ